MKFVRVGWMLKSHMTDSMCFKGWLKIRFVNYIHSGPKVEKKKWVLFFAFFLLQTDYFWRTLQYSETRKNGKSCTVAVLFPPISSTVAVNAHHWKIQAVTSCYWWYFPFLNICCRKKCKNEKKNLVRYPHCFPCHLQLILKQSSPDRKSVV